MFDSQSGTVIGNQIPAITQSLDILYSKNDVSTRQNLIDYVETELASLQDDWDGHGGCAIDKDALEHTLFIFNQLPISVLKYVDKDDILPTANGTITVEWHNGKNELLLDIGKNNATYYIQNQGHTEKINNHFDVSDGEQMQTFIRELNQYFLD